MRTVLLSLTVAAGLAGPLPAAPPSVTSLFPGGAARGSSVTVTATGTFDAWPVRVWASDPAVSGTAATEKGKLTLTVGADAAPGVCWLRLFDATGASQLRPFVVGVLPEVAEAEPNDAPARPQPVTAPAVVNGKLAKTGDVDTFTVRLTRGQTLVAAVEANHTLRSPMDAVLQVVSPTGVVLEQNHDHRGLDPQVAFVAPADGTFLVRLFAFPATPDSSIRHFGSELCVYRLTLTTGGFVESVTPLAVQRGRPAALTLRGWNPPARMALLPADGDLVIPPGLVSGVAIRREPHPCHDLTDGPPPGPLSPPFSATGRLSRAGEIQLVPFNASKGKPLTVRVEADTVGSPLTPVVRVLDAGGKQLATAEPPQLHADCELSFTPPADGTFRVEVGDLHRDGGTRHVYRLRVAATPDFDPTLANDRITVTAGTPLDVPVKLGRTHGFAGDLTWAVEGRPPGVTVRPVPAAGKPDPNTVTLRFEARADGFAGPVRLVASSGTDPGFSRSASVRLAEFGVSTPHLWLTVVPPAPGR